MVALSLPDGKVLCFDASPTGLEVAQSISPHLAKAAYLIRVNDEVWDLTRPIEENASIQILTDRDAETLEVLRHDAAHVIAEAVKELYPETQITIGPAIQDGFYYDFARETPFTPDDLSVIEQRMHEIVDREEPIVREVWQRDDAVDFFKKMGEFYKADIIAAIPASDPITLYRQGAFIDLCRGPHFPSTLKVGHAFKLTKIAGAYWRGDARNPMLQRIYGTVWFKQKDLEDYLHRIEEAERRDHRRLGRELGLFHLQEEAAGSVFWHEKGYTLYREVESYIRRRISAQEYREVKTPQLIDRSLWEASGHWEKFRENMFTAETEDKVLALKPMNCPGHVQIFRQGLKSYRDLPLRMAEFGGCHRNEPSGALHGMMRVRSFVQDDAHIFCTPEQITGETISFCQLLLQVYEDFGFPREQVRIKFSDRPEKRAGSDEVWDNAEAALREAVTATGLSYTLNPGEGAFYGPKLEFVLRDALGRDWQCGTLQVDFVLPERLDASYVGEDGHKHRPVMLHRAILGSLERFIAILIEHYGGKFPLWLAPVQAVVAPITNEYDSYALEVVQTLKNSGLRVESDLRSEKINYKIRELSHLKIPIILVVGKREAEEKTVAVRRLGSTEQQVLALKDVLDKLKEEATSPDLYLK